MKVANSVAAKEAGQTALLAARTQPTLYGHQQLLNAGGAVLQELTRSPVQNERHFYI